MEALPREINFVKVGAVASFLLAAILVAGAASFGVVSLATTRTETEEFLDDLVDSKNLALAASWLFAFLSLLIVPVFLGLYYGLRRWGEGYMGVAVLFAAAAAIFNALNVAAFAAAIAYIVPAWADASDEATRAILLSDARTLAWVSDAMFIPFSVTVAIATIAASLVFLRLRGRLWLGLGWIGLVGGVAGLFGAFELAAEAFGIASFISFILAFFWLLGVGFGLLRLPAAEAAT